MEDTKITIEIGSNVCTVLINECSNGSPWLARYGATMNGEDCPLSVIDDAIMAEYDISDDDDLEGLTLSAVAIVLSLAASGDMPRPSKEVKITLDSIKAKR